MSTFLVGLVSKDRGARRIGIEMAGLRTEVAWQRRRISELEYVNESLKNELADALSGKNCPLGCGLPAADEPSPSSDEDAPADTESEDTGVLPLPLLAGTPEECDNLKLTHSGAAEKPAT